jgi:rod shape-determining protein MreC
VLPFSPVVMADGLVGMVQSADASTSFAITWAHPDFRVSAMSVNESAFGIVQPHLGTGAERWLLELRGVPFRAKLDTGTLIVSSGLGGTYPRGIPVGTILGEIATPEKWARTYLVKPSVLPAAIGPVLVLLPQRATRGVNGVWANMTSADSAARAIAAAGDSLARKAALDELSARRAALDSANAVNGVTDSTALLGVPPIAPPTAGVPVIPLTRTDSLRADSVRRARAGRVDSVRKPTPIPPARALPPGGSSQPGNGAAVRPPGKGAP